MESDREGKTSPCLKGTGHRAVRGGGGGGIARGTNLYQEANEKTKWDNRVRRRRELGF